MAIVMAMAAVVAGYLVAFWWRKCGQTGRWFVNSVKFLQAIFTKYYSIQAIDGSKKYVPPLAYFFVFINGYKSGANRESFFESMHHICDFICILKFCQ